MASATPKLSVQDTDEQTRLLGTNSTPPSTWGRWGYGGGTVASFATFAFGVYSTYSTFAHGRPLDVTKLIASLLLTTKSGICTCYCCVRFVQQLTPRQAELLSSSALEEGKKQKDALMPTIEKLIGIISKHQQAGAKPVEISLENPESLSQLPQIIESLLTALVARADLSERQLTEIRGQLKEKLELLQSLQGTNEKQTLAISAHASALSNQETLKKEIVVRLLSPIVEKLNGIISNPKYQHGDVSLERVSLEDLERAISQQPQMIESLLNGLLSKIEHLGELVRANREILAGRISQRLDESTDSSVYSSATSAPGTPLTASPAKPGAAAVSPLPGQPPFSPIVKGEEQPNNG